MNKTKSKSILNQCKKAINTIFDDAEEARLSKEQMEEIISFISTRLETPVSANGADTEKTTAIKPHVFKTGATADERGAYVHTKSASEKFDQMNGR
jgi:glycyl-tRNA synthetase beta subunit